MPKTRNPLPQPHSAAMALQAKFNQGVALHQQGRLAEAERIYEEILRCQPSHFDALHLLGVVSYQTGRAERGVKLIRQAIMLNAKVVDAHSNLGNALQVLKRPKDALASYDKAIVLKPDYAEGYYNRGLALVDLKRFGEALASYNKAITLKPDYAEAFYNRGIVLRDLGRHGDALASYDRAIALKPHATTYYNRGSELQNLRRPEDALASYDKAIALKPDYAEAYNNRGVTLRELKRPHDSLASYDKAVGLKPDYAEAHNNRGNALRDLSRPAEAVASYDKAIALKPDYAVAYYNRGIAMEDLKHPEDALASYHKAIALKPDYVDAYWNQSLCFLLIGQFEQGWRQYEWRKRRNKPIAVRSYHQPIWLGENDIAGKTLFLYWEQGFGDTIQFCRYAKLLDARGAKIIMAVQEPLHELLKQISPTIEIIHPNESPSDFDYHCPLMSLPLAFKTTLDTIPAENHYLNADEELRAVWSARLRPKTKPRIGVVWSGSTVHQIYHNRSMALEQFLPICTGAAHWICLQKDVSERDIDTLRQIEHIAFFGDELRDFSDTAALLDLMDLVITIDTSVAHLAGAMGKRVWVLLPFIADWRWLLDRSDSPWYPSARLFRQQQTGDWTGVIDQVRYELRSVIE